ncbi:MAG: CocE/NonD family hydrolase [Acidobacteriota bacterium]
MGINKWQSSDMRASAGAQPMTYYLSSAGRANTGAGDGALVAAAPATDNPDKFSYDPMNPVPSFGGNVCCTGNAVQGGSFDQRKMEERPDILVYSTEPLKEGVEVSGLIEVTLYVSSDAKDTDFTVKLIDAAGRTRLQPGRNHPAHALTAMVTTNRRCGWNRARSTK